MPYLDDPEIPQISSADACRAAGIDAATLKNWLSRSPAVLPLAITERVPAGARTVFLFPMRRVYQLAIIAELVRMGLTPKVAAAHATRFTDSGGTSYGGHTRLPGRLFESAETFLVASTTNDSARVVAISPDTHLTKVLADLSPASSGAFFLNLGHVYYRVRSELGLPLRPGASIGEAKAKVAVSDQLERVGAGAE